MAAEFASLVADLERTISSEVERLLRTFEAALPALTTLDATMLPALRRLAELTSALNEPSFAKRTAALLQGLRQRFVELGQAEEWAMAHSLLKQDAPATAGFAAASTGDYSALSQPQLLEALAMLSHTTRPGDDLIREVKRREMERRLMLDLGVGWCRDTDSNTLLDAFDPRVTHVRLNGLRHGLFVAAFRQRQDKEPKYAGSVQAFATTLRSLTGRLLHEVVEPYLANGRVVVSGSAVLYSLLEWDDNKLLRCYDVDLFLIGRGPHDELVAEIQSRFVEAARRRNTAATIHVSGQALCLSCGSEHEIEMQIVLKAVPTVEHLLLATDLDCCSVAYDGTRVLCLPRFVLALATGTNFLDATQRPLQIKRVVKYALRGYCAALPVEFPANFVQPLAYCAAVAGLLYTVRGERDMPLVSTPWSGHDTGSELAIDTCLDIRSSNYYRHPVEAHPPWEVETVEGASLELPPVEMCGALLNSSLAALVAGPVSACGCARCRSLTLRPPPGVKLCALFAKFHMSNSQAAGLYESARFELGGATFELAAMRGRQQMGFALTLCDGGPCAVGFKGTTHTLCAAAPSVPLTALYCGRPRYYYRKDTTTSLTDLLPAPAERVLGPTAGRALRGAWGAPWAPAVHQAFPDAVRFQVRTLYLFAVRGWLCYNHVTAIITFLMETGVADGEPTAGIAPLEDSDEEREEEVVELGILAVAY